MPAWGDQHKLTDQQMADVIAYVITLNPTATGAAPEEIARPSNAGGPGTALHLTGSTTAGQTVFVTNCQKCHGPDGQGGIDNPGSDDGTVPPLNPIDATLISADPQVYAINLDLFLEHGSTPAGSSPQLSMPAWGDQQKLTPQQIADVMAYVISLNNAAGTPPPSEPDIARPSNAGAPGAALDLTGDTAAGQTVFVANCQKCHGPQGQGGIDNPGSDDGTVPPLNPIELDPGCGRPVSQRLQLGSVPRARLDARRLGPAVDHARLGRPTQADRSADRGCDRLRPEPQPLKRRQPSWGGRLPLK